jgi:hypothetical protein
VISRIKWLAKSALAPLIFRYPPSGIQPQRLMYYLQAIVDTASVPGPIVEIGSHLCGTSVIAYKMMKNLGINKPYICVDTFSGFVPDQLATDVAAGTPKRDGFLFADNSIGLVRRVLKVHNATGIQLMQRDCTRLLPVDFPDGISLCLLDVDLSDPIYQGLHRVWPLINCGGKILVDDCEEDSSWKAIKGLKAFCADMGMPLRHPFGMGVLEKLSVPADRTAERAVLA